MKQQTIKFTIAQDGTVREEVIGSSANECLDATLPFEEAIGNLETRQFKPEYYVTSKHTQNETQQETSVDRGMHDAGSSS